MASSDDEDETVPHTVSNYDFVVDKDEPIAFSELPVQWNESEGLDGKSKQIFLHGTADNGLQKIYKQVTAWKFDLSDVKPEIAVLSKENNWIYLQRPRKSFEETIRTILITVHCLHFVKKNPETSGRSLWDYLSKVFSLYEVRPSENDLIDHTTLISEAVKRDETLAKSKFLVTFLEAKPRKKKVFDEDILTTAKAGFIVDDDMIDEFEEDDGSDEEEDLFDSVCSICDNGGDLLCCEGRCMRSFHATVEAGSESACESLGLSDEQVEAIQNFFCKNCQYKKHQCFACGELGSSDKLSGAEVFPCVSATCGRFYHPHCVAKLLHHGSAAEAEELQKKIAAGESFTCPIHKCSVCKLGENKMDPALQFAVCRRCPKSFHKKCLPTKIAFEDDEDQGIVQRAWEGLIPNRILIYCLEHLIDDELCTPDRNHIKFPDDGQQKKKQASQQLSSKVKVLQKERNLASQDAPRKRTHEKVQKGVDLSSNIKEGNSSEKRVRLSTGLDTSKKQKVADTSRRPLNNTAATKVGKSTTDANRASLGERLYALINKDSRNEDTSDSEHKQTLPDKPVAKEMSSSVPLDDDRKRRILALMKDATSSITLEEITKKHKVPVTHAYSSKNVVDKAITLGKVEGSVEALRAALQKLEQGCSIEDATAVFQPVLLHQMVRWKIVDVLHSYVQNGDMIVDFCCGANDFSCLMKKKLDETGKKKCSYKNYDILQPKNDFNFEERDWMSVKLKELPPGSQLIMGLNPPFGVNAALANKFIDKALEFKPKLLILIVPKETERLDKKGYDLIWENNELLAGKSFYLPGSVDINDNQLEDWNVSTPPLYLWSHPDWTAKHKAIAQRQGHLAREQKQSHLEVHDKPLVPDHPMKDHEPNGQTSVALDDHPVQNEVHEQLQERQASVSESHKEGLPRGNGGREVHEQIQERRASVSESHKEGPPRGNGGREVHEQIQERRASVSESHKEGPPRGNGGREVHEQIQERRASVSESHKEGPPRGNGGREVHEQIQERRASVSESHKEGPPRGNGGREVHEQIQERRASVSESHKEGPPRGNGGREVHEQIQERRASVSESHKEGPPRGNGGREVHEQIQERRASVSESHKEGPPRGNGGREVHEQIQERRASVSESHKEGPPRGNGGREVHEQIQERRASVSESHKEGPPRGNGGREVHEQIQERRASVSESHKEGPPRGNGGREVHEQIQERRASVSESHKEDLPRGNGGREVHENRNHGQNRFNRDSKKKKKKHGGKKNGKGFGQTPQKTKERGRSSPASKMYDRVPRCSPPNSSRPLEVLKEGDRHFDQSVDGSRSHYRTGYEGSPADDIARRYGLNSEGPYSGPGPDYGVRNPEGQFGGYQRESTESRVYRPYVSGIEDTYARESAMRSQAGLYGQQGPNTFGQRSGFLAGQDPGFSSYSYLGSAADPSYNRMSTTSTMERYAPRLDEMNHTRMNTLAGEPPRNGIADPLAQQRGYRVDTLGLGFVPGPYRPSSQHNTSGWLNE
ncbi:protein ENHANCED DOWNY MILDEW 2-like isoform X3 [Camellia sinensis]|uniref:protein ENHANCED DOWNY MILDEW 2-like isoform X3 n=1 Tax=Camellia sinensis TaxID=4442 RepID=UPI00103648D4|nr:protein ENHANCED DOWNY MILDEW 2-like isoform X3 [Camellia sinensis]